MGAPQRRQDAGPQAFAEGSEENGAPAVSRIHSVGTAAAVDSSSATICWQQGPRAEAWVHQNRSQPELWVHSRRKLGCQREPDLPSPLADTLACVGSILKTGPLRKIAPVRGEGRRRRWYLMVLCMLGMVPHVDTWMVICSKFGNRTRCRGHGFWPA